MAAKATSNGRRASTQPGRAPLTRLSSAQLAEKQPQGAETLFSHSQVKIVSFSAPSPQRQSSASSVLSNGGGGSPSQTSGTLPWKSRNERVHSVGPLRLYRVPGSVAFLHSGTLLLSLLPRSQCWCVDGQSKFALRNQEMIYRIELPYENDGEKAKVEELKEVLKEVIQYEKTACPFKRGFQVDLPEEPDSPLRRVLVAPPAKGQYWEHDDTWKAETEAKQVKEVSSNKSDLQDEKAASSSISDIQGLTPKSSQEYILEAKPEHGQDFIQSHKERSIRALAGFVSSEASRISKTAAPLETNMIESQAQVDISDSRNVKYNNTEGSARANNASGARHMSTQIDRTPLEPVSKISQSLEETKTKSLDKTISTPPESPKLHPSAEQAHTQPSESHIVDELAAEPDAVSIAHADENSSISDPTSKGEPLKLEMSSEENLTPNSSASPSTPANSSPGRLYGSEVGQMEDTLVNTSTPAVLALEQEFVSVKEEANTESSVSASSSATLHAEAGEPELKTTLAEISESSPVPTVTGDPPNSAIKAVSSERALAVNDNLRPPATPLTPLRRRGSSQALRRARSRHFATDEDLTSSLISRLFGVLLGPPSGLVAIMMQIARRLLAGGPLASGAQAWRLGFRRAKTAKMPGRWVDSEDESVDDDYSDMPNASSHTARSSGKARAGHDDDWDSLDEDDYGVPLSNRYGSSLNLFANNSNDALKARNVKTSDTPESLD